LSMRFNMVIHSDYFLIIKENKLDTNKNDLWEQVV